MKKQKGATLIELIMLGVFWFMFYSFIAAPIYSSYIEYEVRAELER